MKTHFVGTVEEELNGDLRVEGYLFDHPDKAMREIKGRLGRAVNRILTLTLGEFKSKATFSSR